jgi:DNA-binding response OmpR family regulator
MRILIVEDDRLVLNALTKLFQKQDFVSSVHSASSKNRIFVGFDLLDLVILDLNFFGENYDGIDLCKEIRKVNSLVPIIMLSAENRLEYMEQAFKNGANDYIKKPFDFRELLIRVKRWNLFLNKSDLVTQWVYAGLVFDLYANRVFFENQELFLTKKDKIILKMLLAKSEQIVSVEELGNLLWGEDYYVGNHNVRSNIEYLRKRMGPAAAKLIQNVRGQGYILQNCASFDRK